MFRLDALLPLLVELLQLVLDALCIVYELGDVHLEVGNLVQLLDGDGCG